MYSLSRLPEFYRNVVVYVPFVGTGIGLLTILSLLLLEWREKRLSRAKHVHVQVSVYVVKIDRTYKAKSLYSIYYIM